MARSLPQPKAVLCISAHWQTVGTRVTAMEQPRTIHDFYGFPPALYAKQYPAPGAPDLARTVQTMMRESHVTLDAEWGLDHGTWAVLCRMYPGADLPVVQLSLDEQKPPAQHYALGQELKALRQKGVLIVGSGNLVHNLREMAWEDTAYDWALDFDARLTKLITAGNHPALVNYSQLGPSARLAVPSLEHYLPLLYVLAAQGNGERVTFFTERVTLGSISMRSLKLG